METIGDQDMMKRKNVEIKRKNGTTIKIILENKQYGSNKCRICI